MYKTYSYENLKELAIKQNVLVSYNDKDKTLVLSGTITLN